MTRRSREAIKWMAIGRKRSIVAVWSDRDRQERTSSMAKGMNKRGRDEKKPKKEAPKVTAAAPSLKNVVSTTVSKAKTK